MGTQTPGAQTRVIELQVREVCGKNEQAV